MGQRIPQSFIDDVLARTDIVSLIDERVPLKRTGKNYQACCPFHDERTPSFSVNPDQQFFYCFGCGAGGNAISFLMRYENYEFLDALEELAGYAGLKLPEREGDPGRDLAQGLYPLLTRAQEYFAGQLRHHPSAHKAVDYLKSRGLSGEVAARFGVGYAPPGWRNLIEHLAGVSQGDIERAGLAVANADRSYDRFRDRITFPIRDRRGRVIGFGARALGDEKPKYLNSPETPLFQKGRELYGLYEARKASSSLDRVFIVEGYMDVIALAQFGVTNAVATLGTATTAEHLATLFRLTEDVVFCFDGDEAGRTAAWRALKVALTGIGEGRYVSFLFLPEGEDPDTLVRNQGTAAFTDPEALTPLSAFLFDQLAAGLDLAIPDHRTRLLDLARPLLADITSPSLRLTLMQRLEQLTGLSQGQLNDVVPDATERPATPPNRRATPGGGRVSLVRQAIHILVHHPELGASSLEPARLAELDRPGAELLTDLLGQCQAQTGLSMGGLLERYRGTAYEEALSKLAVMPLPEAEHDPGETLRAALEKLAQQASRPALPPPGATPSALSEEQKARLRNRRRPGNG